MTPEQQTIIDELNKYLSEHSEQSLSRACALITNKELRDHIIKCGSLAYFLRASFIYRNEKSINSSVTFFDHLSSLDEVYNKLQKYKFFLWNLEFDVNSQEAINSILHDIQQGLLSVAALGFLVESYSFNKEKMKEVFGL